MNFHVAHPPPVFYFRQLLSGRGSHRRAERILGLNTDFRVSKKEAVGDDLETLLAFSPQPPTLSLALSF